METCVSQKLKEMDYVEKIAGKISNISVNGNGALVEQLKQIFYQQNKPKQTSGTGLMLDVLLSDF